MIRKVLICFLVCSTFSFNSFAGEPLAVYGNAWLEQEGEYPVVHLRGTEREMGIQLGFLVGDRFQEQVNNLRSIGEHDVKDLAKIPDWLFIGLRRFIGAIYYTTYPKDIKEQIKGIVIGAKMRPEHIKLHTMDIAFMNTLIDLTGFVNAIAEKLGIQPSVMRIMKWVGIPAINSNCDSMAVWGPRTQGGKTFQNRNTDIETGNGVEKLPLIMIEKKDGAIPIASASITGMLGIFAGMNAYGVGVGQIWATSNDVKIWTPWQHQIREAFLQAHSASEAVTLFSQMGRVGYGSNFVFADAGNGGNGYESEGYAVEANSKNLAIFKSNDPRELDAKVGGKTYGLPLAYSVMRGDVSMDQTIRKDQPAAAGPTGDPTTTGSYGDRYRGLYDRILAYEKAGVLMGVDETIAISRETAMKKSNLLNAIYANTDRNMWVAYSKMNDDGSTTQAYQRDYVNIPFYQYLSTMEYDGSQVLTVKSYRPDKSRNLVVKLYRGKDLLDDSIRFTADRELLTLNVKAQSGDLFELRDRETNALVDRLVAR